MSFKVSIILGLAALAAASPVASPQLLDLDFIAAQGPAPTPIIAIGQTAQVITFDATSAASAAVAAVTQAAAADATVTAAVNKRNNIAARSACDPLALGSGPTPSNDTPSKWLAMPNWAAAASAAPLVSGYDVSFINQQGANNANGYLGYYTMKSYDVAQCASKCDAASGCAAFNVYFERGPVVIPGDGCPNPNSTTTIKCVLWGGPVTIANAVNRGQWQDEFQVLTAGNNGYVNHNIDDVPGYSSAEYLGNAAINSPSSANSHLGFVLFSDGSPFDAGRCAAACTAKTQMIQAAAADNSTAQACNFFNTYILSNNSMPIGQSCSMYDRAWPNSYATNNGQYDQYGNHVGVSYSYSFSVKN